MATKKFLLFIMYMCTLSFAVTGKGEEISKAYSAKSLCNQNEIIFFSCKTKREKIISLCGYGSIDNPDYIYYIYGRKDNIEMKYPSENNKSSIDKFRYSHYFRFQRDDTSVSFGSGDYYYTVFSYYDGEENIDKPVESYGVAVNQYKNIKNKPLSAEIKCATKPINNMLPRTGDFLKCEEEGGLFCDNQSDYGN